MSENATPFDTGLSCPDHSSCGSGVMAGFVDVGMHVEVVGDGMAVCQFLDLVVCSVAEDNAIDLEAEQLHQSSGPRLASVFWGNMVYFDTSVTRMAVSVRCFSGSHQFLCIYHFSLPLHPEYLCRQMFFEVQVV